MKTVKLGSLEVSKFIVGSNPISGFSHQTAEVSARMRHYFSAAQVKRLFRDAEALGVRTVIARADVHIVRLLMEYWDEGGKLEWIAQTCPEVGTMERGVQIALGGGASACYLHGGWMDHLLAGGRMDEVQPLIDSVRAGGIPAGIAGHNPDVFRWAEANLDLDFYMCCYYNPSSRAHSPEHDPAVKEWFLDTDRQTMVELIATLSRPAIHYKVLAAGRNKPEEAFEFVRKHMRAEDAVCVGIYDEDDPAMLRRDLEMLGLHAVDASPARHII